MNPIKTTVGISLYILALGGTAYAQVAAPETAPVPPAQTAPEPVKATITTPDPVKPAAKPTRTAQSDYRISREDSITITCLNAPEYNVAATVLPDGTISYPKMGQIKVVGKTLKQVEAQITTFLKKEFVRPQVSVAVRDRQVRQVAVTGTGVKTTGKRVMRDGWTVRDAISDAGGLVSDRTDLFEGTLIRYETGELIPIDLNAIYSNEGSASNLPLDPNDTLIINASDESKSQVLVSGEVIRPGFVLIPRDHTISK
ncbi:MAG: polysaccharide biosynthesis/export family protein, partial [Armatimonadetes bacterium]|nr:polysaccharide biosynthesis/export family protein [Armatimonadota bacterium]